MRIKSIIKILDDFVKILQVKCTVATRHSELDLASLVVRHFDIVNESMTCPHISADLLSNTSLI